MENQTIIRQVEKNHGVKTERTSYLCHFCPKLEQIDPKTAPSLKLKSGYVIYFCSEETKKKWMKKYNYS